MNFKEWMVMSFTVALIVIPKHTNHNLKLKNLRVQIHQESKGGRLLLNYRMSFPNSHSHLQQ